jgi:3-oxoacyl-[acyl-carrier protein] reductase
MSSAGGAPNPHEGRIAVVTGAGRGIGRSIALAIASAGARVLILGRDAQRLDETRTAAESEVNAGCRVEPLACDITDEATVEALRARAPHIDLLILNAAAYAPYAVLERSEEDDLRAVWETIYTSSLRLARFALPHMKARRFGRIVLIGSVAASLGATGQVAYASAKAALVGMTRSLACESAKYQITCNLVELGLIDTERVAEAVSSDRRRLLLERIPAGRLGTCDEVAKVVSFLLSDDASYVNGAVIPVTGGLGLGLLPFAREQTDAAL